VAEEFIVLLIADPCVDKNKLPAFFYQQAAHGPVAKIVFIGGIRFVPYGFGDNAKHGAAIQLKISCIDNMYFHGRCSYVDSKFREYLK